MNKVLSYEGFYKWHLIKTSPSYNSYTLYKVCSSTGAFFALTYISNIELNHLNDSSITYRNLIVFKSGSPWDMWATNEEKLHDNLVIAPLEEHDLGKIKAAIKFIRLKITSEKGYNKDYWYSVVEDYLDSLDELENKFKVKQTLNLFCHEIN